MEEVVKHFKINIKEENVFSRCMICNCDEFLVASKIDMIRAKYQMLYNVPNELVHFCNNPDKYSKIEFQSAKVFNFWKRYQGEKFTKYGGKIDGSVADGTLRVFQTFYICERCAKLYWDGGHYKNNCGGKFDHLFNLFPQAETA